MNVLASVGPVLLNMFRTQIDRERQARALASGLRVQSAVDDPSGLAIAETIQTKVSGLQQAVDNVQTANNLLTVADGAVATVQDILMRMRSLVVEAHSDVESVHDLQNIQAEIDSLLKQIDTIAGDAKFNGLTLFDGSLSDALPSVPQVIAIASEPNADGSIPPTNVSKQQLTGTPGPLVYNVVVGQVGFVPALVEFRVTGYSVNPTDPILGPLGTPGDYLQIVAYSNDARFGAGRQTVQVSAVPTNAGPDGGSGAPGMITAPSGLYNLIQADLANLEPGDVGTAMTFITTAGTAGGTGRPLEINDAGGEGTVTAISLPTLSANALGIDGISVLAPTLVDEFNNVQGTDSSNQYAADDAEARVSLALAQVNGLRAQIGAQSVALQENANDASVAIVNQVAAESAIRDTNVGAATSAYTKDQILGQIGTSVLAQMSGDAHLTALLLVQTFAAAPARSRA